MAPERPMEEPYDVQEDPHETQNLIGSAEHREILRAMRHRLDRRIWETDDQGRFPEDPEVYEYYDRQMKEIYEARIKELQEKWGVE